MSAREVKIVIVMISTEIEPFASIRFERFSSGYYKYQNQFKESEKNASNLLVPSLSLGTRSFILAICRRLIIQVSHRIVKVNSKRIE